MKIQLTVLSLIGILSCLSVKAQKYTYDWMKMVTFDKEMVDYDMKIQADKAGYTYSTFSFQWDIHLGRPPSNKKDPEPPILSAEGAIKGVYIDKREPNGDVVWAKVIKIGNADKEDNLSFAFNNLQDLAVADNGDIYITGAFDRTADFGQGITVKSEGRSDMYVAKINPDGETQWVIRAGGSGNEWAECDPGGRSVAVDKAGNVFVLSALNGWPNGGGTIGSEPLNLSKDGVAAVLFKISSEGKVLWNKKATAGTFIGPNSDMSIDDAGNVYMSGSAQFFAEWDGNKTDVNGMRDAVLFKLDNNGKHIWTKLWGWGNGKSDGKTADIETIERMSVTGDGRVTMMLSLYNGAEFNGIKIKTDKLNAYNMETMAVNLDASGNVTNMTRFASKDAQQMVIGMPNQLSPGFQGANGTIYFNIGSKVTINDEKLKGDGIYSVNADGEVTFLMSLVIKDIAPVHGYGPIGFAMNNKDELFSIGQVMLISDLVAQFSGSAAGKRIEKQNNKNYYYDKDFNQGIVVVKYTN